MVRQVSAERVEWVSERTRYKRKMVKEVLTADREYSNNHKRQPRPLVPEGGISISEAERKYGIHNVTISRWARQGYVKTLLRTKREVYISESDVARLAEIYKGNPGRGSWAIRKACEASTLT